MHQSSICTEADVGPDLFDLQDQQMVLGELQGRNPDMDVSQFKRDVRAGKLLHICIQLESQGNKAESFEFLRTNALLNGDGAIA